MGLTLMGEPFDYLVRTASPWPIWVRDGRSVRESCDIAGLAIRPIRTHRSQGQRLRLTMKEHALLLDQHVPHLARTAAWDATTHDMMEWCDANCSTNSWYPFGTGVRFRFEEDRMRFMLTWS